MVSRMIAVTAISLAIAAPVWAASGRNQADMAPLSEPQMARSQTGSTESTLAEQQQRQEVQRLLKKLEAGQHVDPAEVESVLRRSLNQE